MIRHAGLQNEFGMNNPMNSGMGGDNFNQHANASGFISSAGVNPMGN